MSVQSREYEIYECWISYETAFSNTTCPLSEDVAVREVVPHTPLSLLYRSAQISAVLLRACSG